MSPGRHAGFAGAVARVLDAYLPQRRKALDAMAEQAAHSRLLVGIHFRHDSEDGLLLGVKAAHKVLKRFAIETLPNREQRHSLAQR